MGKRWESSKQTIIEWFFRNSGLRHRNSVTLLMGFLAAILLLSTQALDESRAAWVFAALVAIIALLFVVRPRREREVDRFSWGVFVIVVLGFGLGILCFRYQEMFRWLWSQYRRINEPHEFVLEALFLLGVILGFFVVRNWAKEQKEFLSSLSAVLGGTFLAAILGELKQDKLDTLTTFGYYALGFTISGTLNLLVAARLTASYTNRGSVRSRAMLDFLYGSERAKIIDGYFLKNFEEDPDYAKRWLTDTIIEYRNLVRREFARRMQAKRERRRGAWFYYWLLAIECHTPPQGETRPQESDADKNAKNQSWVVYRTVKEEEEITDEMFRAGVSIRRQDTLEYITAPGQYKQPFPFLGSTLGLALSVRQTIVMDRDRKKRFRSKDYKEGRCPADVEQPRGLDEIDFLSYICIPVVSRLGSPIENPLGVVNVDTRLFASDKDLHVEDESPPSSSTDSEVVDMEKGVYRKKFCLEELTRLGSELYDQEDEDVKYLEELTRVIVPVLELYLKCRQGAT